MSSTRNTAGWDLAKKDSHKEGDHMFGGGQRGGTGNSPSVVRQ